MATTAWATDEIQVYTAEINDPGVLSVEVHTNYVQSGLGQKQNQAGYISNHSLNGTPEFAYGMTDWWELGAYLPYTLQSDGDSYLEGPKLRTLFVSPHADEIPFFYGVNYELSYAPPIFADHRWNLEVRPIIGIRFKPIEVIVNPIVDIPLTGGRSDVEVVPALRVGYILDDVWKVALENYSDFGTLARFQSVDRQSQELFAVVDYGGEPVDIEFGIGHGFTAASDDTTIKLIIGHKF